jgi:diadenosine tetraphosphate (Ap4A) HIT family hydrolase
MVEGFNIGMNCGEAAGQTIMHCHVHLTPWRKGDVAEPRGGVRGKYPVRLHIERHARPRDQGKSEPSESSCCDLGFLIRD